MYSLAGETDQSHPRSQTDWRASWSSWARQRRAAYFRSDYVGCVSINSNKLHVWSCSPHWLVPAHLPTKSQLCSTVICRCYAAFKMETSMLLMPLYCHFPTYVCIWLTDWRSRVAPRLQTIKLIGSFCKNKIHREFILLCVLLLIWRYINVFMNITNLWVSFQG